MFADDKTSLNESLIESVRSGDAEKVRQLLESGADPNAAIDTGATALHYSAQAHRLEIMKALIAAGADVNRKDQFGRTPMLEAMTPEFFKRREAGSAHIVKFLLDAGARPDDQAMAAAAAFRSLKTVDLLREAGANISEGMIGAASAGHLDLVKRYLTEGANVNHKSQHGGTALHRVVARHELGRSGQHALEMVQLLIRHGADVNARNERGQTPLHVASRRDGDIAMVKLLLEAAAIPNIPDNEGVTPIRRAAIDGEGEIHQMLLKANGGAETIASGYLQDTSTKSTEELIADLGARDGVTRKAAETALVIRGEKIMPAVLKALRAGDGIEKFKDIFIKLGPAAAAALPELEARLSEPKSAFWIIVIMNQMKPGHFETLPRPRQDEAAAAIFRFVTESEEDPMILGMMAEGFPNLVGEASEPYVLKLLHSDVVQHREDALDGLAGSAFATDQLRRELVNVLQHDADKKMRERAATALGNPVFHTPEIEAILRDIVLNPPPVGPVRPPALVGEQFAEWGPVARAAAHSLMKVAPDQAEELAETIIDKMLPFLSPINAPGRMTALGIIDSLGTPAIPRLIELLKHENDDVAISASVALNKIRRPAVRALSATIQEGNDKVVERAANALWWIGRGAKDALPALVEVAASKKHSDVARMATARAALKIDPEVRSSPAIITAVPSLIRVLEGGNFRHQGEAAEALGQIGPAARQALPALRKRLEPPPADIDTGGLVRGYVSRAAKEAILAIENKQRSDQP